MRGSGLILSLMNETALTILMHVHTLVYTCQQVISNSETELDAFKSYLQDQIDRFLIDVAFKMSIDFMLV